MAQNHHIDQTDLGPRVPFFALNGPAAGPRLVVTGPDALMRALADLLWDRCELATIRGKVILRTDDQNPAFDLPDAVLALEGGVDDASQALFHLLDRIAALGMMPVDQRTAA